MFIVCACFLCERVCCTFLPATLTKLGVHACKSYRRVCVSSGSTNILLSLFAAACVPWRRAVCPDASRATMSYAIVRNARLHFLYVEHIVTSICNVPGQRCLGYHASRSCPQINTGTILSHKDLCIYVRPHTWESRRVFMRTCRRRGASGSRRTLECVAGWGHPIDNRARRRSSSPWCDRLKPRLRH